VDAIRANPRVGLTFSSRDSWVAATGTAEIVDDLGKLRELWNTFAEAWLPGGPEDPNATLVRVDIDGGEYWDTPGGASRVIAQLRQDQGDRRYLRRRPR